MQTLPKSRLLQFVEQAMHLDRRAVARYSSKFSKQRYTLHQHIVLLCLKGTKEYDIPDAARRTHRDASDSESNRT